MGYEYKSVSDTFINARLHSGLRDYLYTVCYNLSSTLGDDGGKINPTSVKQITNGLSITSPGVVLLGEADVNTSDPSDDIIEDVLYINEISPHAYDFYTKYNLNDSSVVISDSFTTEINSPLLSLSTSISPTQKSAVGALYLDCMALYHQLLEATPEAGLASITKQDLYRMDNNIRWLSQDLERKRYKQYELIEVIRELQLTLMFVRSVKQLFSTTYSSKIRNLSGGVGDDV